MSRKRTTLARELRRDATDVERRLWAALRAAGPELKFRRQHPIGRFVVDFACPARKLAIEIDGGQHADRTEEDAARTAELTMHGYRVIRFWNHEVAENVGGVVQAILIAAEVGPTSP
jgi:very-short-patch-repair endonuclease